MSVLYKKKCKSCGKFTKVKTSWNYCMVCYEKKYGRYEGEDRDLFVEDGGIKF